MLVKQSYTSGEAARLCGLGLSTLKRWIKRGALRAYRTPGGDLRILHSCLLDFMREFDIPLHQIQPKPAQTVMIAVENEEIRAKLASAAKAWGEQIKLVFAENDLSLGFALASNQPDIIIMQARHDSCNGTRCKDLRKILAPRQVRIGMVSTDASAPVCDPESQPEVFATKEDNEEWAIQFIYRLVGHGATPEVNFVNQMARIANQNLEAGA